MKTKKPIDIDNLAPARNFEYSIYDNVGLNIIIKDKKMKEELMIKEIDSYLLTYLLT